MQLNLNDLEKAALIRHAAQLARENNERAWRLHQLIEEVETVAGRLAFSQPQASSLLWLWWRRARDRRRFDDWLNSLVERLEKAVEVAKPVYIDGGMVTPAEKAKLGSAATPESHTHGI